MAVNSFPSDRRMPWIGLARAPDDQPAVKRCADWRLVPPPELDPRAYKAIPFTCHRLASGVLILFQ